MITVIVAFDKNYVIGDSKTNRMPWHIPEELKLFKELTRFHPIVMGRKTAESVGPLKDRLNLVLSRDKDYNLPGFTTVSFEDVKSISSHSEVMICGGAKVYELFIKLANRIIISGMNFYSDGDVKFPIDYFNSLIYYIESSNIIYKSNLFTTTEYFLSDTI